MTMSTVHVYNVGWWFWCMCALYGVCRAMTQCMMLCASGSWRRGCRGVLRVRCAPTAPTMMTCCGPRSSHWPCSCATTAWCLAGQHLHL